MVTADAEVAWAAGLFEGEGCICPGGKKGSQTVQMAIGMTDEDTLRRFARAIGHGNVTGPHHHPRRKSVFRWTIAKRDKVLMILQLFMPFLGARRRARAVSLLFPAPSELTS